jgi:peptidoglycan/LPS O-acetylase OafA/YrhL
MVGLGRALVVVGVAVWPVWGVLFLTGSAPNVGYALLAHLALVVPGGILVRRGAPPGPRPARKRLGDALIVFGVLAWVPYFILREQGVDTASAPFLVWHLLGVIPGSILRYTRVGRAPAGSKPGGAGPGTGYP